MQGGIFGHLCVLNWLENVPALENLEIGNTSKELQRAPIYTSCLHSICFGLLDSRNQDSSGGLSLPDQLPLIPKISILSIAIDMQLAPVLISDHKKGQLAVIPLGLKLTYPLHFHWCSLSLPTRSHGPWNRQHPCDPTPPLSPTQELWWSNYPVYHRALTPNLDLP